MNIKEKIEKIVYSADITESTLLAVLYKWFCDNKNGKCEISMNEIFEELSNVCDCKKLSAIKIYKMIESFYNYGIIVLHAESNMEKFIYYITKEVSDELKKEKNKDIPEDEIEYFILEFLYLVKYIDSYWEFNTSIHYKYIKIYIKNKIKKDIDIDEIERKIKILIDKKFIEIKKQSVELDKNSSIGFYFKVNKKDADLFLNLIFRKTNIEFSKINSIYYGLITLYVFKIKEETLYNDENYKIFKINKFIKYIELQYKYNLEFNDYFLSLLKDEFFVKKIVDYVLRFDGTRNYICIIDNDNIYIKLKRWVVEGSNRLNKFYDECYKYINFLKDFEKKIFIELLEYYKNNYKGEEFVTLKFIKIKTFREMNFNDVENLIKSFIKKEIIIGEINGTEIIYMFQLNLFFELYLKYVKNINVDKIINE